MELKLCILLLLHRSASIAHEVLFGPGFDNFQHAFLKDVPVTS